MQIIGVAASKSIEKSGILGGLFSSYNVYLLAWSSATSHSLSWDGEILRFGVHSRDHFIVSS